ncbi:tyrosine-type recombinase/integrase [Bacteroides ovatus]|uniref:site-specific integrase n=1 Tax=Bacteroides ovatus TaxID=28116 RepID=UPI0011071F0C|nr:site-specific integrase [Bacteroides ovatus]MCS2289378.1 site-specific integrase [Bacteroides fragilis]MDC2575040.1 tyrosine-type recombinase/integrase [Bacteroides ovatus]MDC2580297.1 tyrosine-type recombinase/integrase [Bacteroides ovatus]MDC2585201.1 tyrosine-type recombinase/integrase [Bacteroides ovatus]MDC2595447.1 tyrosine-type recombinase/integrase [Bacteroides ovatus]
MKVEKFKVLLYLKKSGLDKSGKAPIMGRITVNRTMAQFGCKLSCTPELWNPRESRLNGKSREAVETNAKIEKLLLAVNSAFDSLLERRQEFDATAVKDMVQGSMEKQMTLLRQFDRINEELKSRVGIDRAEGTYSKQCYTRQILAEFIRNRFKTEDIAFGQLYERFIWDFQDYVLDVKKQSLQSVRHYLALLKKVCRIAYKDGHSERYFFCNFKLPKQEISAPKALTREEFVKVRDVEISVKRRPSLALTRDLFLFACYVGTAYADTVSITRDNLFTDDEGDLWLKYHRKKNEYLARVKLLPEAIALLEKYKDDSRETLLPVQDYRVLRANMKSLRVLAGIKTDIVYHVGRHSFASLITLEEGVPIETISRMLGHTNIQTTQIYARVTPKKLFEDMDRFVEATKDLQLVL